MLGIEKNQQVEHDKKLYHSSFEIGDMIEISFKSGDKTCGFISYIYPEALRLETLEHKEVIN